MSFQRDDDRRTEERQAHTAQCMRGSNLHGNPWDEEAPALESNANATTVRSSLQSLIPSADAVYSMSASQIRLGTRGGDISATSAATD